MPESIVGFFKSCKECWPLLFASNIVGKTKKQVRGIRITEAIIIGLVLAGGAELRDLNKTEKAMMKEDTKAIMEMQEKGFTEIKAIIEKNNDTTNQRLDSYNIVLQNVIGRVGKLEGTMNSWEVHSGN